MHSPVGRSSLCLAPTSRPCPPQTRGPDRFIIDKFCGTRIFPHAEPTRPPSAHRSRCNKPTGETHNKSETLEGHAALAIGCAFHSYKLLNIYCILFTLSTGACVCVHVSRERPTYQARAIDAYASRVRSIGQRGIIYYVLSPVPGVSVCTHGPTYIWLRIFAHINQRRRSAKNGKKISWTGGGQEIVCVC